MTDKLSDDDRDAFETVRDGLREEGKRESTMLAKAELHDALVALVRMRRGAP